MWSFFINRIVALRARLAGDPDAHGGVDGVVGWSSRAGPCTALAGVTQGCAVCVAGTAGGRQLDRAKRQKKLIANLTKRKTLRLEERLSYVCPGCKEPRGPYPPRQFHLNFRNHVCVCALETDTELECLEYAVKKGGQKLKKILENGIKEKVKKAPGPHSYRSGNRTRGASGE